MESYQNFKRYIKLMYELTSLKLAKSHIINLAFAEKCNATERDKDHIFKMTLRHYEFGNFENKINQLESQLHKIHLTKNELIELEKHVDVKQLKNEDCNIVLDEVNFLHVKLINHINS